MHQYIINFILEWHSTSFGRSFRPSSWVQDCAYSNRHLSNRCCCLLLASRKQYLFDICLLLYVQSWTHDDGYCCLFASKQRAVSVWHTPIAVCTVLNSWWWTERTSETRRVSFQNKISDTLVHLVGFTIEMHYDAWPYERRRKYRQFHYSRRRRRQRL